MSGLSFLGLYPDAIEDAIDICEEAIAGAKEIVQRYSTDNDYDCLDIDLDDRAKEVMKEWFDFEEMSNSIIGAYFKATVDTLNECPFFSDMNIEFEGYTNCHDSHLYMNLPDGSTIKLLEDTDVISGVTDTIVDKLHGAIETYLDEQDSDFKYPREFVEEDVQDERFSDGDITEFLDTGELTEDMITKVTDYAIPKDVPKDAINIRITDVGHYEDKGYTIKNCGGDLYAYKPTEDTEKDYLQRPEIFRSLINADDIDLMNKLSNMYESEISEACYNKCNEPEVFKQIENKVLELMQNENEPFSNPYYYEGLADEYDAPDEREKISGEVYNCDLLYMTAIADVLELERPRDAGDYLKLKGHKQVDMDR